MRNRIEREDAEKRLKSAPAGKMCVSTKGKGYECQLKLEENVILYPDFTILKMPQRKVAYLEHLGMLDDEKYFESTLWRINVYERNGIYLGKDLFLTYEIGKQPLNSRILDRKLRSWFLGE